MIYRPVLPALAESIAIWFPELEGRSLAVSEVNPFDNKTNVPTLPVAVVALVRENNDEKGGGNTRIKLQDDILVEFIYEPVKYKREDGQETPFFAYYDYENTRDRLLAGLRNWRTPRGGGVAYVSLDIDSDEYAVYITIRLRTSEDWSVNCVKSIDEDNCEPNIPAPVVSIASGLYPAKSDCCPEFEPCPDPIDPCDEARDRNPYGKEP